MIFENREKIIYEHDTAIKNGQVHQWKLMKFKIQDLHDLFIETLLWINYVSKKINSNCIQLTPLH